jgi:serine protease inhibitor
MTKFKPNKKFLAAGQKYGASVETLKSASQVNSWCNAKTHGKIKKILDKLESNIRMILLNAVYFKGFWYKPFKKSLTMKRPFYNLNNKS